MGDTNNTEEQAKDKQSEKVETTCKIYVKQPHEIMKSASKSTNDDVQRAIEGLKEIPDEELQEFLDDEAFMEGLDVVDAWEGDEEKNREAEQLPADSTQQQEKPSSRKRLIPKAMIDGESNYRERHQRPAREHKGSNREKPKKEEKKREDTQRRDPAKSTKDIERDKIRTKRDTESKLLAEKEKAIKHLLDSDNVVPPGTETEAIQSIAERQNLERAQQQRERRSRERRRSVDRYSRPSPPRRKSPERIIRLSPHRRIALSPDRRRSPFGRVSPERHRSPLGYSPGKRRNSPRYISDRRSPSLSSPERRRSPRRLSWERRSSVDRRWRRDMHERRRSRSRDRRSRSVEHPRRRSSRSPINRRYSPRRRSRTRSRSPEKRPRKRSPFINELARQLRDEALKPSSSNANSSNSGGGYPAATMLNVYQPDAADTTRQVLAGPTYMHQSGSQPPLPPPPPPPPPPPSSSSVMSMQNVPPNFMSFEMPVVPMTFDIPPMPSQTLPPPADYASGPVMYNQQNATPIPPPPVIRASMHPASVSSPQPVPAPTLDHGQLPYNPSHVSSVQQPQSIHQFENKPSIAALAAATTSSTVPSSQSYNEHKPHYNNASYHQQHEERLKTPEPPVISRPKQFEKTSLSSLLEASVSAKDPSNIPVLYPGFNPEIMRNCEQALCQLPYEDPRLKMTGRFFYARNEEDMKYETEDHGSNSILLQKSKTKIFWEENTEQPARIAKPAAQMHQKICQTDEVETKTRAVQATVLMVDRESQVHPHDIQQASREERRPIMDRLDWGARDTYDYSPPKFREMDDLRLHLSNTSQRRSWNRQASPSRRPDTVDHEHRLDPIDHGSRNARMDSSPLRNRDNYSGHRVRDHYGHPRYSPEYRRSMERDDYHDRRSEHSRGESPMELEDSDENGGEDDDLVTGHTFQREPEWHGRGRPFRGKSHIYRGKHSGGRPYRSRGGYRGSKF